MNEDLKEYLGVGKHDWIYYPGGVLVVVGLMMRDPLWSPAAYGLSLLFLGAFLWKSYPRYAHDPDLKQTTRIFGLVGNVLLTLGHLAVCAYGLSRL